MYINAADYQLLYPKDYALLPVKRVEPPYFIYFSGPKTKGGIKKEGPFDNEGDAIRHAAREGGFKRPPLDGWYQVFDSAGRMTLSSERIPTPSDLGIWIDPRRYFQTPAPGGLPGFLAPYQAAYHVEFSGPRTGGKKVIKGPFATWQQAEQYAIREGGLQAGQGYYQVIDATGLPLDIKEGPGL